LNQKRVGNTHAMVVGQAQVRKKRIIQK